MIDDLFSFLFLSYVKVFCFYYYLRRFLIPMSDGANLYLHSHQKSSSIHSALKVTHAFKHNTFYTIYFRFLLKFRWKQQTNWCRKIGGLLFVVIKNTPHWLRQTVPDTYLSNFQLFVRSSCVPKERLIRLDRPDSYWKGKHFDLALGEKHRHRFSLSHLVCFDWNNGVVLNAHISWCFMTIRESSHSLIVRRQLQRSSYIRE